MGKQKKQIADTGLWRRIVREVRDQRIADTEEGKLSTTKIKVVEKRYILRGGQFNTPEKFVVPFTVKSPAIVTFLPVRS